MRWPIMAARDGMGWDVDSQMGVDECPHAMGVLRTLSAVIACESGYAGSPTGWMGTKLAQKQGTAE